MTQELPPGWQAVYDRTCESYHAVDDFRMKLLGPLPIATGSGVFLLLGGKTDLLGGKRYLRRLLEQGDVRWDDRGRLIAVEQMATAGMVDVPGPDLDRQAMAGTSTGESDGSRR